MTSPDSNPSFQYLCDLCLTQYTFWCDHSFTWIWCHPYRVLPLARGLTFHIYFILEDNTGFIWNPNQWDFEPISLDYHNPMKLSNFTRVPNLIPIPLFHSAEAQNEELVLFLYMPVERFWSQPSTLFVGDVKGQWSLCVAAMGQCPRTGRCSCLSQDVQMQRWELSPGEMDTHPWLHPTPAQRHVWTRRKNTVGNGMSKVLQGEQVCLLER